MHNFVKPPNIKSGDKIAIVAPSGLVEKDYIDKAISLFSNWGLEVMYGKNLFAKYHQFAGSDIQRLTDLQWALDDEDIKTVCCARGGYGALRILDKIHWHKFIQNPKWLLGFSDITAIHSVIHNNSIQSLHSIMPINIGGLSISSKPVEYLKSAIFDGKLNYEIEPHSLNRTGTEKAVVIGGNLSILYALAGTQQDINYKGKILFIEDIGEQFYHIDRMMQSLRLAGKLEKLSGLIVGGMSEMQDNKRPFGRTPEEIISDAVEGFDYPVAFNFPAGHITNNYPIIFGSELAFEVTAQNVSIRM